MLYFRVKFEANNEPFLSDTVQEFSVTLLATLMANSYSSGGFDYV